MTIEEAVKTLHFLKLQTGRIGNEAMDMGISALRAQQEHTIPCDLCGYNPPSSFDGKPCTMCPAVPKQPPEVEVTR